MTLKSGLGRLPGPGLGVVCADFDGDRWPDIFVANDAKPNRLWVNQKDGTFKDEAVLRGVACNALGQAQSDMGVALADVDGDGLFDLLTTHLPEEAPGLWVQGPRGRFRDRTGPSALASSAWRGTDFGAVLEDFDHDGAADAALVNGRVTRGRPSDAAAPGSFWLLYAERNQLLVNDGTGRFRDASPDNADFCGTPALGRGLACGDVDGDGALDLLVSNAAGPAKLYRNVAPGRGRWLTVRCVDPTYGGRDAYGAEVTVRDGPRRWVRLINPNASYLSSHAPHAHFGLGRSERVDAVEVAWPDGSRETFAGAADRSLVLKKGEGQR